MKLTKYLSAIFVLTILFSGCIDYNEKYTMTRKFQIEISIIWDSDELFSLLLPCPVYSWYKLGTHLEGEGKPIDPLYQLSISQGNGIVTIKSLNDTYMIEIQSNETIEIIYHENNSATLAKLHYQFARLSNKVNDTSNYSYYYNSSSDNQILLSYNTYQQTGDWHSRFYFQNVYLKKGWNTIQFSSEFRY